MPTVYANRNNEQKVFSKKKSLQLEVQDRKTKRQIDFSCPNLFQHFQLLAIHSSEFSDMGINSYRNGQKRAEYEALTALNGASMQ